MTDPKNRVSRGAERLGALLKPSNPPQISKPEMAKALKVSTQTIWVWVRGQARPKFEHMLELKRLYGIDPSEWGDDPGEASAEPTPAFPADGEPANGGTGHAA